VRVARFADGDDPRFGVVGDDDGVETIAVLKGDPLYAGFELTGQKLALADVRLLAPVIPRSKVVCVGKNYAAHAAEMAAILGGDGKVPDEPLVFLKPNTAVVGPGDAIVHPTYTNDISFEGELAIVISRICKDVPAADAEKVIFGYTIANDVSARDLQVKDNQWARAKGSDTFCPLGPWIETKLEPGNQNITTAVNGEVLQRGNTGDMTWQVPAIIEFISSFTTLLPGDVVLTGTPAGVGTLKPGDDVTVTIDGIGTLQNRVVAA
jgi:2-keto-4-pentenoate hydratase/2-oxohepta-3-ene-1,7-dioic acid hydratase in catechol pathway